MKKNVTGILKGLICFEILSNLMSCHSNSFLHLIPAHLFIINTFFMFLWLFLLYFLNWIPRMMINSNFKQRHLNYMHILPMSTIYPIKGRNGLGTMIIVRSKVTRYTMSSGRDAMVGSSILWRHFRLRTSSAKPRNIIQQIDRRAAKNCTYCKMEITISLDIHTT